MYLIKCESLLKCAVPYEVIVHFETLDGNDEIIVHPSRIVNNCVTINGIVSMNEKGCLVELPTETSNGSRRVWVSSDNLIQGGFISA
ncbi:MAG: hypothetical protein WC284_11525 [Candidimonas sp.]